MYKLIKQGDSFNSPVADFTVDTASDLSVIPLNQILFGSKAYVIDSKETYIADSDKQWKLAGSSGGGGGEGPTDAHIREVIKKYLEDNPVSPWESGEGLNSVQTKDSDCRAKGESGVAEGYMTHAGIDDGIEDWSEGKGAHAEGGDTTAAGNYSHTEGGSTVANNPYEHAQGHFNISNFTQAVYPSAGNTIHSVGVGTNLQNRKNAEEIMQNGDMYVINLGNYDGKNATSSNTQTLQAVITNKQNSTLIDEGSYYTIKTVEGALQEIGEKLQNIPTEMWQGGAY